MQVANDSQISTNLQKLCNDKHGFEPHPKKDEGCEQLPRDYSKIQDGEWLESEATFAPPFDVAPELTEPDHRWPNFHGSTMCTRDETTVSADQIESTMLTSTSSTALSECFHSRICFFSGCSDPNQKYTYKIVENFRATYPTPLIEGDEYCLVDPSLKKEHFDGQVRVILILVNCTSESGSKEHLFVLPEGQHDDELEYISGRDEWLAF